MGRHQDESTSHPPRMAANCRAYREATEGIQFVKIPWHMEPERVCLSTLSPVEKREVWQNLMGTPLGDLLKEPTLQELVQHFDAQIHIRKEDL